MHIAAKRGQYIIVKWLLGNGYINLANMFSAEGMRPVHLAIKANEKKIVRLFTWNYREGFIKTELTDRDGWSWVEHAMLSNDKEIVHLGKMEKYEEVKSSGLIKLLEDKAPSSKVVSSLINDIFSVFADKDYLTDFLFKVFASLQISTSISVSLSLPLLQTTVLSASFAVLISCEST